MTFIVRAPLPADIVPAHRLLSENGWDRRIGSAEQFALLIRASQRAAVAVGGGEIIGFARGITDGLSNGYLSMVVVAPSHRRHGVGSALVRHVIGEDDRITWVLRAGRPGADRFFRQLGFDNSTVAMERRRGSSAG